MIRLRLAVDVTSITTYQAGTHIVHYALYGFHVFLFALFHVGRRYIRTQSESKHVASTTKVLFRRTKTRRKVAINIWYAPNDLIFQLQLTLRCSIRYTRGSRGDRYASISMKLCTSVS